MCIIICRITIHIGQLNKKEMKDKASSVKVELPHNNLMRGGCIMSKSITQDMAYRQSLM